MSKIKHPSCFGAAFSSCMTCFRCEWEFECEQQRAKKANDGYDESVIQSILKKTPVGNNKQLRVSKDEYYLGIALAVSKRSTCLKRHYGCVIVKNDEIIATGYNGSPRGESNCCDIGYCKRLNKPHNTGDYSDCNSVHAEQNALLSASRKDMLGSIVYLVGEEVIKCLDVDNAYNFKEIIDATPCPICSRMIKNAGCIRVVSRGGDAPCLQSTSHF